MLLLFQRMFWEGQVLMLLYLIVDHLYDASLVLEDFFQLVQDYTYNQTFKPLFIVVIFWMVHNDKIFRRSSDLFRRSNLKSSISI